MLDGLQEDGVVSAEHHEWWVCHRRRYRAAVKMAAQCRDLRHFFRHSPKSGGRGWRPVQRRIERDRLRWGRVIRGSDRGEAKKPSAMVTRRRTAQRPLVEEVEKRFEPWSCSALGGSRRTQKRNAKDITTIREVILGSGQDGHAITVFRSIRCCCSARILRTYPMASPQDLVVTWPL
jgi:hypothetical protein